MLTDLLIGFCVWFCVGVVGAWVFGRFTQSVNRKRDDLFVDYRKKTTY